MKISQETMVEIMKQDFIRLALEAFKEAHGGPHTEKHLREITGDQLIDVMAQNGIRLVFDNLKTFDSLERLFEKI